MNSFVYHTLRPVPVFTALLLAVLIVACIILPRVNEVPQPADTGRSSQLELHDHDGTTAP